MDDPEEKNLITGQCAIGNSGNMWEASYNYNGTDYYT
jgi:hypothetical protein